MNTVVRLTETLAYQFIDDFVTICSIGDKEG